MTVAGASGFVGSNLLPKLVEAGAHVRGVFHMNEPQSRLPEVEYVQADLTTADGCKRAVANTDVFIMAAANSSGAQIMASRPLTHLTPNVVMNALTLEAAHEAGVSKYCFLSSNTVYPPGEHPMTEGDVNGQFFEAYKVVAEMKLYSEKMVEHFSSVQSSPMGCLIVRPANLYGPFDKFSEPHSKVIPSLIRRAVRRENPFVVWGDGRDIKDFLFISDFVDALIKSLALGTRHAVLNIASGSSLSLREILPTILHNADFESATIEFDSAKPSMIPVRRISNTKAQQLLGWKPMVEIDEGIRLTIDWYRRQTEARG